MQIQSWLNEGQMLHLYNLKCNFFNNTDLEYVPASSLFDFVSNFKQFSPKTFKKVSIFWDKKLL